MFTNDATKFIWDNSERNETCFICIKWCLLVASICQSWQIVYMVCEGSFLQVSSRSPTAHARPLVSFLLNKELICCRDTRWRHKMTVYRSWQTGFLGVVISWLLKRKSKKGLVWTSFASKNRKKITANLHGLPICVCVFSRSNNKSHYFEH